MSSKQKTVIIGAGGHAKVIIDILQHDSSIEIIGCTDKSEKPQIMGIPLLGDDSILPTLFADDIRHAFVAIGDNKLRYKIAVQVEKLGFTLINAISPFAYVAPLFTVRIRNCDHAQRSHKCRSSSPSLRSH